MEIVKKEKVCARCLGRIITRVYRGRTESTCGKCFGPPGGRAVMLILKCGHEVLAIDGYRDYEISCETCDAAEIRRRKSQQVSIARRKRRPAFI